MTRAEPAGRRLASEDLASTSKHSCLALGNVVLTRSLCAPDAAFAHAWSSAIVRYGRARPQGLGMLVFLDANAQPPNEEERAMLKGYSRSMSPVIRGAVQVVEGRGFIAAAMRGVLAIINRTEGMGFPVKVANSVAEAVPLLAKLLGPAMDPRVDEAALTQLAEEQRARLKVESFIR